MIQTITHAGGADCACTSKLTPYHSTSMLLTKTATCCNPLIYDFTGDRKNLADP
jgi:hypothetical protein